MIEDMIYHIALFVSNPKDLLSLMIASKVICHEHAVRERLSRLVFESIVHNKKIPFMKYITRFPEFAKMKSMLDEKTLLHRTYMIISEFEWLINMGADVNAQDIQGDTPLHIASATSVPTITWLINAGADTNIVNKLGQTILHVVNSTIGAALIIDKNFTLLEMKDITGHTPYQNIFVRYAQNYF
jgi:ankyrin repeat protein